MKANSEGIAELLIKVIGKEAAMKMMSTKGLAGCRLDVPKSAVGLGGGKVLFLRSVLGKESTEKLMTHFGGEKFYVPNDSERTRKQRNQQVVAAHAKGSTVCELSGEFNLSDRWIHQILKTTDMSERL